MRHCEGLVSTHQRLHRIGNVLIAVNFVAYLNATGPIVLGNFVVTLHNIARGIHTSVLREGEELSAAALRFKDTPAHRFVLRRYGTRLVIVVDEVGHRGIFAAVSRTMVPVIDDVVDEVEHATPSNRRIAPRVVSPKVAHESGILTAYRTAEGMVVSVQSLGRDGVLYGHVHCGFLTVAKFVAEREHVAVERDILVEAPLTRAVVNHDIADRIAAERVLAIPYMRIAAAETHVAHHHVVGVHLEALSRHADTVAGSRLSSNGHVGRPDNDRRFQANNAAHVEYDDTGSTLFAGPAERAGTVIVEVVHHEYFSASAAKRIHAATLSTGEGGNLCLFQIVWAESPRHIRTAVHSLFDNYWKGYFPCTVAVRYPFLLK